MRKIFTPALVPVNGQFRIVRGDKVFDATGKQL
jgi:hypothetical protein